MLPSGKFPRIALFTALSAVVLFVYDLEFIPSASRRLLFSNSLDSLVVALAAFSCLYVALRCSGYARQVWMLLATAFGLETVAQVLTTYYQSFVAGSSFAPQPSDIFFFVWAAPVFMILLPRSNEDTCGFDYLCLLDFLQIAIVGVTVYLYFFYFTSAWQSDHFLVLRRILLLYIARDLFLSVAFFFRTRSSPPSWFRSFSMALAFAFLAAVASDADYLFTLTHSATTATWADLLWMLPCFFVIGIAVFWDPLRAQTLAALYPPAGGASFFNTQLFPVLMPLLVIFMARAISREHALLAWIILAASVSCSSIRLVLTNRRQRRISDDLLSAETALVRSQQLLSTAFRASPDGFAINVFPDGPFLDVSDSFTRLTGYTRQEVIHKTPLEMNLWLDPSRRRAILEGLTQTGDVRDVEFQFRTKDGHIRTGQLSGSLINLDGRKCALVAVRDITERKAAEELLRTSEERFRSLVNNLHVGILSYDAQARIIFANQATLDTLRVSLDQIVGKTTAELGIHSFREDGTRVSDAERVVPGVISTHQPVQNRLLGWYIPGRAEIRWTNLDAIPEFDSTGELLRVVVSFTDVTEQRRATEEIRQNEERFRSLVNNLHVGIVSCDAEGRILFVNQAILDLFSVRAEKVLGRIVYDLGLVGLAEDGSPLPESHRPVQSAIRSGQPSFNQLIGLRRPGSQQVIWAIFDVVPQRDSSGKPVRFLISIVDVTEQRRAAEALRENEERFRSFVESLHVGIVSCNARAQILYANPAALEMFGMRVEQITGRTEAELGLQVLREDGSIIPDSEGLVPAIVASRRPIHNRIIGWQHIESNQTIWTLLDAIPQFNSFGEVTEILFSLTNLTEQRRATEALRESEERFRTLVRDLHVGVVLHNPDGSIQFANRAALAMFGFSLEEVVGKMPFRMGLTPVDVSGNLLPIEKLPAQMVVRTKLPAFNQVLGWRKNGNSEVLWVFGNAVPQFSPDGSVLRVISSFADITEMKNAERAIHQLSTELLKLQDDERRRIGRELHDGMAQTVLAINLSLAQIRHSAQPLSETSTRALDKARELLQQMSREIRTLSYLLHPPLLDDLGLVTALKEYVNGFSERCGIECSLDVPQRFRRLPQIVETAFFRITQESLANIQRHSGSKLAKVALREEPESVVLEITDYGHGMSLPANGGSRRSPPRMGVGIPGMRERMAQLGGYLDIESNSQGTTVRARILMSAPVLKEPQRDESAPAYRG